MKLKAGIYFSGIAGIALLLGCGAQMQDINSVDGKEGGNRQFNSFMSVPVNIDHQQTSVGFSLAAASAYSISLDGCASGYTSVTTQAHADMKVYKFDQTCLAKLTTFTYGAIVYVPKSGAGFTTWLAGDTAVFEESGNPANTTNVTVLTQLASPIGVADTVSYRFSEIAAGADVTIPKTIVGEPHTITVSSLNAPAYFVKSYTYSGMTAAGAGQFRFTLECNTAVIGTGATLQCDEILLNKIKYVLVKDTFGGVLTLTTAAVLFGGVAVNPAVDGLTPGSGGTVNGGFITPTGAGVLAGPNQMHLNKDMLLVLQGDGTSYTYYKVAIELVTQP